MDDEPLFHVVRPGEPRALVSAFRQAVAAVGRWRIEMLAAGLDPDGGDVVAGWDEHGAAAVHITVYPVVAVQLSLIIDEFDTSRAPPHEEEAG